MKKFILPMLVLIGLTACDNKGTTDDTKNRARAEEEASVDVVNSRAAKMEADLQKRYRLYSGMSGEFEGTFKIKENSYRAQLTVVPTIHVLESDRIRTIEEIQDDLNNLYINTHIRIWLADGTIGIGSCIFEEVRPDINTGVLHLFSSECPNSLEIRLSNQNTRKSDRENVSKAIAEALVSGEQDEASYLHAKVNSKHNPVGYEVLFKRQK